MSSDFAPAPLLATDGQKTHRNRAGKKYSKLALVVDAFKWITIFFISFLVSSFAHAADHNWQRMRLPVGQYWIPGGGGAKPPSEHIALARGDTGPTSSYIMPAYCIDEGRRAPRSDTSLPALAGDATVARYLDGKIVDQRPLADAISGPSPWISLSGRTITGYLNKNFGSAKDITLTVLDNKYDYAINITGITLSGTDKSEVDKAVSDWRSNSSLMVVSNAFDALRRIILVDSSNSDTATYLENFRQELEWSELGDSSLGGRISEANPDAEEWGAALDNRIMSGIQEAERPPEITPAGRLSWIMLARGRALNESDLKALATTVAKISFDITEHPVDLSTSSAAALRPLSALYALSHRSTGLHHDLTDRFGRSPVLSRLFQRTVIESRPFENALRLASMDQFATSDQSSGQIEYDIIDALHCVELSDKQLPAAQSDLRRYLIALRDLADALSIYRTGFQDTRVVKLTRRGADICLQWFDNEGQLTTKKIPREAATSEFLRSFGPARFVVADDDDEVDSERRDAPAELKVETVTAARITAAASLLTNGERGAAPDRIVTARRNPARSSAGSIAGGLEVGILGLQGNGDAGVLTLPDGSLVLIDTGRDAGLVKRLSSYVDRNAPAAKRKIRLVITHTHQDHIGGLIAILDAKFQISEIIIGTSVRDSRMSGVIANLTARLIAEKYRVDATTPNLIHFVGPDITPWLDLENGRRENEGVETLVLRADPDLDIRLHHVIDAPTPNDAGFVVRIQYDATSWLFTDDLTARSMSLLTQALPANQLAAGIMKWPHHLWFPTTSFANRRKLDEFLGKVGAHSYAFSNKGHVSHTSNRYDVIVDYLRKNISRGVKTFWTGEKGSPLNLVFR